MASNSVSLEDCVLHVPSAVKPSEWQEASAYWHLGKAAQLQTSVVYGIHRHRCVPAPSLAEC